MKVKSLHTLIKTEQPSTLFWSLNLNMIKCRVNSVIFFDLCSFFNDKVELAKQLKTYTWNTLTI
jgi:hypothetical protein